MIILVTILLSSVVQRLLPRRQPEGVEAISSLMNAIDTTAEPTRETDKPLLMSVEDVFSITGRGTVATGRIERGIKVGEEIEIVGMGETAKTTVTVLKCSVNNSIKVWQVTM